MTIVRLIEGGIPINKVNIGGMSFSQEEGSIDEAVSVDENDRNAFKQLHEQASFSRYKFCPMIPLLIL